MPEQRQDAISLFRYCPVCGSPRFEKNDFKSLCCRDCGFVCYQNAGASVVGVVVNSRNELLVGRRAFNPAKGMLDLPGGFVDAGESLEQAVVRELQEETGATVIPERWLFSLPNTYRYSGMDIPTVDSFFLCRLQDNADLHGQDDISSLFWHPLDRLRPDDFGMASVRHAIPLLRQRLEE